MNAEYLQDALRWRWLAKHARLGFDGAPSWNAVVRLPALSSKDATIEALVDRGMENQEEDDAQKT